MPERQSSPGEGTARPESDVTENGGEAAPGAHPGAAVGTTEQPAAVAPGGERAASGADRGVDGVDGAPGEPAAAGARPSPAPRPTPVGEAPSPASRRAPSPPPHPQPSSRVDVAPASTTVASAIGPTVETPVGDESPTVRTPSGGVPNGQSGTATRAGAEGTTQKVAAQNPRLQQAPPPSGEGATVALRTPPLPARSSWFTSVDAETTQVLPRTPAPPPAAQSAPQPPPQPPPAQPVSSPQVQEPVTERIPVTPAAPPPPPPDAGRPVDMDDDGGRPPRAKRKLLVLSSVLGALALLYVADLVFSSGSVPRGVTVTGVPVGGLGLDEAEERLRAEIGPRTTRPVEVAVGGATGEIDPATAGLAVDWPATMDAVGAAPLNPITRITSFFTQREVGVVTDLDPAALRSALEELSPVVDRAPTEGAVRFDGLEPRPVDPTPGQQLDVAAAAEVMQREWVTGQTVALPLTQLPPITGPEDVAAAIEQVARPAVSAPVTVVGENGAQGTITPEDIASALLFRADGGALVPEINQQAVEAVLDPQLAPSERPGRNATIDFSSGSPQVIPSQDGRGVDYPTTLATLLDVLTGNGPRQVTAVYGDQPAEVTTEEIKGMGIKELIGEFTTGGFAADSGRNIKRAAEQINGMVVQPGATFSLNEATVPRNAANGYVEAGIISDGHASRGVGGGVSQVATTLYNAAYFAGMVDVHHQEHSFYISRYPPGREATVFEGSIDLKWRNDNPTGVLIETKWTPSSLTVRLYGTKRYEVTSTPGPRTNPTEPHTVKIPAGEPCSPSGGAPGFTITDTRTLREISTGEVRSEKRTVRYNPSPTVACNG